MRNSRAPPSARPRPSPSPARPSARSIVGHKQSAPKQAGVKRAATAAPARTRAAAAPSQPPLPSPQSLSPSPPRPAGPAQAVARPRQPPPTAARASRAGPLAPPLRPHGRRALSSPRLVLSHLAGTRASGAAMRAQFQAAHWPRRGGPR